jgi:hypothetical protein
MEQIATGIGLEADDRTVSASVSDPLALRHVQDQLAEDSSSNPIEIVAVEMDLKPASHVPPHNRDGAAFARRPRRSSPRSHSVSRVRHRRLC